MRCIFCQQNSTGSLSVEHIVPESLGNTDHVLPAGVVCDLCNQYFARKVERPLLESPMFRLLRADMSVPNKRGRLPRWSPEDGSRLPDYRQMGRFLAKVGLEVLAFKTLREPSSNEELVDNEALNELRRFARFNQGADWPFSARALYPVNAVFAEENHEFQLLHEFDILVTPSSEAYLVLALFGVELALNLGGRANEGYKRWLEASRQASPLYVSRQT